MVKLKNYKITVVVTAEDESGHRVILQHRTDEEGVESVKGGESIDYEERDGEHVPLRVHYSLSYVKRLD